MAIKSVDQLQQVRDEQDKLFNAIQQIKDVAEEQDRDLEDDEVTKIDELAARMTALQKRIPSLEKLVEIENQLTESRGRKVPSAGVKPAPATGFESFGNFLQAVCRSGKQGEWTPQLRQLINAGQSISVGSEGGVTLPPEFMTTIYQAVTSGQNLASRCRNYSTLRNSIEWAADESTPWGTTGVQVYWEGEGQSTTASGVTLDPRLIRLNKLMAWVPLTNEAIEDAPFLTSYVQEKLTEAYNEAITHAIINGNGGKQPLGILKSPALITTAKEGSQSADTIVIGNILEMYMRIKPQSVGNVVWLHSHDILRQLFSMSLATGASTSGMVFMPAGGLSVTPYNTLMGREMIPCMSCQKLGDLGDIIAADLSEYAILTKTSGPRVDLDMSFYFDVDKSALRVVYRVGGFPIPSTATSPRYGTVTVSPFVTLAERA